ncbi:IS4 family transposase [Fibrobacterota bacterium]
MTENKTIFSQILDYLPVYDFNKCVNRYQGNYKIKTFTCRNHFYVMAFAQLTFRESLRDIESTLNAMRKKLYHIGIRTAIRRTTLAKANETRDWRIYADFAMHLISIARPLYANEDIGIELDQMIYALDATTIDLCLSVFPWARFRKKKAAIKLHTLIDVHGNIPLFIWITDGKVHDVNVLDILIPEPGSIYLIDRGYIDFSRLYNLTQAQSFFVTLAKSNMQYRRISSSPVDKSTGLRSDQIIMLTGINTSKEYPEKIRRIHYYDSDQDLRLIFLTNNMTLPALTIAKLYKCRWQVELFFKWIKQNLRIKRFFGTSENAVKTQIWIAICIYLLVAIIKKKLKIEESLYTILQVLSVSLFEKMPILQAFQSIDSDESISVDGIQLNLFEL